ncbi:MAG TPA: phage tail tube protein [Solirubrobacterales bacterium]|nr:phage tail tube protein [Solirubrobacterales bacterium]
MPNGYLQELFESLPGNEANAPTLSTKKIYPPIQSVALKPGVKPLSRDDELRNQDEPLAVIPDAFEPSWEQKARVYPDLVGWRLKHILGNPVTTAGDGIIKDPDEVAIPIGAHRHVFKAPFGPAGASPLTTQMTAAYSDQGTYFRLKGAACAEFSLETPEEGGANFSASGPGLYLARIANPSLTPTYEALSIRPFVRGNLSLEWVGGSGTTQDFSLSVSNPVEAVRSLGIASKYPDIMEKANEGPIVVSGSIPKRQLDPDDYDALINSAGFEALARWVGDSVIALGYPYKLFVEFANCQYVGGEPDALANQRRHGASFDWKSTALTTGSTTVTLVNSTTSYA